jgi:hypothetical protein
MFEAGFGYKTPRVLQSQEDKTLTLGDSKSKQVVQRLDDMFHDMFVY